MTALRMNNNMEAEYFSGDGKSADGGAKRMKLSYYLLESAPDMGSPVASAGPDSARGEPPPGGAVKTYGVSIKKTEGEAVEETYVGDITSDAEKAYALMRLLAENLVTPCCLRDVVEDICAEW